MAPNASSVQMYPQLAVCLDAEAALSVRTPLARPRVQIQTIVSMSRPLRSTETHSQTDKHCGTDIHSLHLSAPPPAQHRRPTPQTASACAGVSETLPWKLLLVSPKSTLHSPAGFAGSGMNSTSSLLLLLLLLFYFTSVQVPPALLRHRLGFVFSEIYTLYILVTCTKSA